MKEFKEFIKERVVRKQHPDRARSKDLIEEADRKLENLKRIITKIGIDDKNSNDIIEDCHDIILGLVRAKMFIEGFSASGKGAHEAEVSYLEKMKFNEEEIEFVNKLRYFRNGILYYGKIFDKEYATKVINFMKKFKARVK
ncbi:hypothetical protein COU53_01050 [Candidatus Pacearchaeota archaeon CG10_big_fil_rev_8_21_14_0_10_30_48]|nr:MAG: hypothetical protein COU53_01050 [Candidatus Pacearchaeota archaeon CG10_big_fil_rev_8_21_14_0_10_30_48]